MTDERDSYRDRHASLVGVLRQMAAGTVSDTRAWAQQIIDGIDAQTPASPETGVRIRDLGRLSRGCSHGIYHHGCLSCDRQDPEERLWEEGTDA